MGMDVLLHNVVHDKQLFSNHSATLFLGFCPPNARPSAPGFRRSIQYSGFLPENGAHAYPVLAGQGHCLVHGVEAAGAADGAAHAGHFHHNCLAHPRLPLGTCPQPGHRVLDYYQFVLDEQRVFRVRYGAGGAPHHGQAPGAGAVSDWAGHSAVLLPGAETSRCAVRTVNFF